MVKSQARPRSMLGYSDILAAQVESEEKTQVKPQSITIQLSTLNTFLLGLIAFLVLFPLLKSEFAFDALKAILQSYQGAYCPLQPPCPKIVCPPCNDQKEE